jgi:hypothetical protein
LSIAFITSFNIELYHKYGKRFLEEFDYYADSKLKMFVVYEGNENINHLKKFSNKIEILPFNSEPQKKFLSYFGNLAEANGLKIEIQPGLNGKKRINFQFDYRFNAVRFSFKPFAVHQIAMEHHEKFDYLNWIDADLRCVANFGEKEIERFLPKKNELMAFLARKNSYSECGFLAFNTKHNNFMQYLNEIINTYNTGKIFSLEQWHDSWIWDKCRIKFEKEFHILNRNISGKGYDSNHPFVLSGLQDYFDHLKGPERKKKGKSNPDDFKT